MEQFFGGGHFIGKKVIFDKKTKEIHFNFNIYELF